jgi:FAD:protein FMN transferase
MLGTFVTISAYGAETEKLQRAVSAAFDEFQFVDDRMSLHRADSELAHLNQQAATNWVSVSAELFEVISTAQRIAEETNGSFDITIAPLTKLWGFLWKEHRLPRPEELEAVLPCVDYRLIELDSIRRSVRFRRNGVTLDLNGIAKGYAVDRAIDALQANGVTVAMVKAGGDLRVIGAPPGHATWTVQLEDANQKQRRRTVELANSALSTSGNYENFFVAGTNRYAHILDPRTGLPVQGIAACTVIASRCIESDAMATALFVFGRERSALKFNERVAFEFTMMPTNLAEPKFTVVASDLFPKTRR